MASLPLTKVNQHVCGGSPISHVVGDLGPFLALMRLPPASRYYPFHYAPCASDIVDIESIQVNFKLGKPFLPFQQLLGVLPAASCKHLPKPYHWLFTDPKSPILDFYPQDFECDFEGKRADYEASPLPPALPRAGGAVCLL